MTASERSITAMHAQRDFVKIQFDDALDGRQNPKYKDLIELWPCNIQYVSGSETLHGRQLEGHITAVVTGTWDFNEFGQYYTNMRMIVIEGMLPNQILNIESMNPIRFVHRQHAVEFLCSSLN